VKLLPWQREFIEEIYNNPHTTRRAILSLGRKNGKTTLVACLLLVHLCGPEAKKRPNSQIYSAAQSRDQAAIVFNYAAKMIRLNEDLAKAVIIRDTAKQLYCPGLGTSYRALSAEATTAFGLSPAMTIFDELGQICPRKQIKPLQNMGFQTAASGLSILPRSKRPDPHETWLSMALNRTAGKLRESIPWGREAAPGRD